MNDFIGLHYGGSGTKIGLQFWNKLRQQHQIDNNKDDHKGYLSYFRQKQNGSYMNRGIFVDTDPQIKQLVLPFRNQISSDLVISSNHSCRNIFAQGAYGIGAQLRQLTVQKLRKQIQINDKRLDVFHTFSISGGAGSGMTNHTLCTIKDHFPDNMNKYIQIIPQINGNFSSLQVYNAILNNYYSVQQPDLIVLFQNKAVNYRLFKKCNLHPSIGQINKQIADCLLQLTTPFRFSGSLNTNIRKIVTNIVPFRRLKYLSPITSFTFQKNYIQSAINSKNSFIQKMLDNQKKMLAISINVRGDPFSYEAEIYSQIKTKLKQQFSQFVYWIPNNLQISITSQPNKTKLPSASSLTNSQQNVKWLKILKEQFGKLFRRKAFLHYYLNIGMDQMQFNQAQSNTDDLLCDYFPWSPQQSQYSQYDQYD